MQLLHKKRDKGDIKLPGKHHHSHQDQNGQSKVKKVFFGEQTGKNAFRFFLFRFSEVFCNKESHQNGGDQQQYAAGKKGFGISEEVGKDPAGEGSGQYPGIHRTVQRA